MSSIGRNDAVIAMRKDDLDTKYHVVPPKMTNAERERLKRQHASWIKYIVLCAFIGAAVGVITVWLTLYFNVGGLGGMLARSSSRLAVTALLTAGFASTFGMIAMGVGIMIRSTMAEETDE